MPLPHIAPAQRKWWVIGVLGIGLGVALSIWYGLAYAKQQVTVTVMAYKITGDSSVEVTYNVHRPQQLAAICHVRALDSAFGTVGSQDVTIPASAPTNVQQVTNVRTTQRAVTGTVTGCEFVPETGR